MKPPQISSNGNPAEFSVIDPIFSCLADIRKELNDPNRNLSFYSQKNLNRIIDSTVMLPAPSRIHVENQIKNSFSNPTSGKSLIDSPDLSFLAAFFHAKYAPLLGFEFFEYQRLDPSQEVTARFPSIAIPVRLVRHSEGLSPGRTVALFPENWIHKKSSQLEPDDRVYYFIDKFVKRHMTITQRLIGLCCDPGSFESLRSATEKEIELACSNWVTIHEHCHRHGALPLPEFLAVKSTRAAAAVEELRVDLYGVLEVGRLTTLDPRMKAINREFILAERLLRYAVEADPETDYDAIGTQVLFRFLETHQAISIKNGLLSIGSQCWSTLELLFEVIDSVERKASTLPPTEQKKIMQVLAKGFGNFSIEKNNYQRARFFEECRQRFEQLSPQRPLAA